MTFIKDKITVETLVEVVLGDVLQELQEGLAPVLQLHPHQGEGHHLHDGVCHVVVGGGGEMTELAAETWLVLARGEESSQKLKSCRTEVLVLHRVVGGPALPPPYLLLPLHEPPQPLLGLQLAPPGQDGDGRRQHDGDRVGVVGVGADLGVLGGDLIDVEIVVVVVSE